MTTGNVDAVPLEESPAQATAGTPALASGKSTTTTTTTTTLNLKTGDVAAETAPSLPLSARTGGREVQLKQVETEGEEVEESLLPTPRSSGSSPFPTTSFGSRRPRQEGRRVKSFQRKKATEPENTTAAPSPSSTLRKTNTDQEQHTQQTQPQQQQHGLANCEVTTASNKYFSEPSLSPDDDEDDTSRIKAPHRLSIAGGRAFHREDDAFLSNQLPPHSRFIGQASPVPSSPGNTSLSSWDSPCRTKHRVLLQFTPSAFRSGAVNNSTLSGMSSPRQPPPTPPQSSDNVNGYHPRPSGAGAATSSSGNAAMSASSPDRGALSIHTPPPTRKQFTQEANAHAESGGGGSGIGLINGEPAVPLPSLNEIPPGGQDILLNNADTSASVDSSFLRLLDGIKDANSATDSLRFDATGAPLENQYPRIRDNGGSLHHPSATAEESIIMDLSESEDDIILNNSDIYRSNNNINAGDNSQLGPDVFPSRTSTFDSGYMHDQTADDEKTLLTDSDFVAIEKKHSKQAPFTRARSGDTAAATLTLSTGGTDWKGMKMDNIPLPSSADHDDVDEEEDDNDENEKNERPRYKQNMEEVVHGPPPLQLPSLQSTNYKEENPVQSAPSSNQQAEAHNNKDASSDSSGQEEQIPRQPLHVNAMPEEHLAAQDRQQPPLYPPSRPALTRPPKPETRTLVPPHLIPPPPGLIAPPPDPNYSYQTPAAQSGYVPSYAPQSPHGSSRNAWGNPQYQWASQNDGFVHNNHSMSERLPPRWADHTPSYPYYQPNGDSLQSRDRMNSWGSMPVEYQNVQRTASERRHSWASNARAGPSMRARNDSDQSSHHSVDNRSHQSGNMYSGNGAAGPIVEDASSSDEEEGFDNFDQNQPLRNSQYSATRREELEQLDGRGYRVNFPQPGGLMRGIKNNLTSPFANIGKKSEGRVSRASFFPKTSLAEEDEKKYPTFMCPNCKTRQREFFSVSNAPKQFEGPSGYLAAYFILYVTASLFIFGLEEGWEPLDCIYFAVISLTTAGLGDFVPTTDANKIICSIFIYFGVACIGLLLGSYIAGMLDDKAYTDAKAKQAEACPNCARIQTARDAAAKRLESSISSYGTTRNSQMFHSERIGIPGSVTPHMAIYVPRHKQHGSHSQKSSHQQAWQDESTEDLPEDEIPPPPPPPLGPPPPHPLYGSSPQFSLPSQLSPMSNNVLGSPMTRQILGRQSHTRHASFDIGQKTFFGAGDSTGYPMVSNPYQQHHRKYSDSGPFLTPMVIKEGEAVSQDPMQPHGQNGYPFTNSATSNGPSTLNHLPSDDFDESSEGETSVSSVDQIVDERVYRIKAAKYVFLTLREALGNSLVILAIGCVGFFLIENFTLVDSWYFTTVLLTTTGYGDIVPITRGGKLFATIYLLVGGTTLLNNMSLISMIPLELRKRRIERAVLTQFGDSLDDDALRELATGPLIKRLSLTVNRSDGLAECTREMFALAMLVRLGKVSEDDIRQTFAAFRRLDLNNEGVLNSKSIIAGMIQRRRTNMNPMSASAQRDSQRARQEVEQHEAMQAMAAAANCPPPVPNDMAMNGFYPNGQDMHYGSQVATPMAQGEMSSLLHQPSPTYGSHPGASPPASHYPLESAPSIHPYHSTSPSFRHYEAPY